MSDVERCHICNHEIEYVAGKDGQGMYPHCWSCWEAEKERSDDY